MPLQFDEDSDDDAERISPCPFCLEMIHSEVDQCPYCKNYISDECDAPDRKKWWIVVATVLLIGPVGVGILGSLAGVPEFLHDEGPGLLNILGVSALILVAGAAFLLLDLFMRRALRVSLLCRLGLHRWKKECSGTGRTRRHVYRCSRCEEIKEP